MKTIKKIYFFIKEVIDKWVDDKAAKLGAAVSFYTIFSLAPLLIIAISVAGVIFGEDAARGRIVTEIHGLIGREGAEVVQTAIKNANQSSSNWYAIVFSIVTLIIGSTVVFVEIQDSLNMIWKVKPKPERNPIIGFLKDRLISFAMVVATGFLLLVSLLISTVLSALADYITKSFVSIPIQLLQISNIIISFSVIFILFAMIFKVLPDVQIAWSDVWVGAAVTSGLFVLGKYLIGLYLGTSTLSSTYGAAGSLVVLLLWIYYSAQILYLGAEFTQVYSNRFGSGIKPADAFMRYKQKDTLLDSE